MTAVTDRPADGGPLACTFQIGVDAAFLIEPDHENGLVILRLAADPWCRALVAPEVAFDAALRLVASVNRLRRPPEARP